MKRSRDLLKTYFQTGDTPTEQQFADWLDSYFHKDDAVAIENIAGLQVILNDLQDLQISDISGLQDKINKLDNLQISDISGLQGALDSLGNIQISDVQNLTSVLSTITSNIESIIVNYVQKEAGKGLSKNDFTDALKAKLEGIPTGGFEIKGEYLNNGLAIADGLSAGDVYSVPIESHEEVAYLAVVKSLALYLNLRFDDIDADTATLGITDKENKVDWNTFFTSREANGTLINVQASTIDEDESNTIRLRIDLLSSTLNLSGMLLKSVILQNILTVVDLDLSNNLIEDVDSTVFQNLNLVSLNLSQNNLTEFFPNGDVLEKLIVLDLSHNQLGVYNPNVSLAKLQTLNISFNQIDTSFSPSRLLEAVELTSINVSNNVGIVVFDYGLFPESIESINFSNCSIVGYGASVPPVSLKTLNLSSNNFADTFAIDQPFHEGFETLDLSNNQIAFFGSNAGNIPAFPSTFKNLYLTQNLLTEFPIVDDIFPDTMELLELSQNNINVFDPTRALPPYLNLLGLANNGIVNFDTTIALNSGLKQLVLSANPIVNFAPTLPLPALTFIGLANTSITTASWNANTAWIANVGNDGYFAAQSTTNPVTGTATETLLLAKNWSINI